jgi:hypothetical protein
MTRLITRIKSDLPKRISAQIARVNGGLEPEKDYLELRRLQSMLTDELVAAANGAAIRMTRETLILLNKLDFPEGETIRVSKYAIECHKRKTIAWNVSTFQDLKSNDMPQYLRVFVL